MKISIHRFRDTVAFDCDDTETIYLTPETAIKLAEQLVRYAVDCNKSYSESKLGITEVK